MEREKQKKMRQKALGFELSNPGFIMTFESQAEVTQLLEQEDISDLIYQSVRDQGFSEATSPRVLLKNERAAPYFISGFEVNKLSENGLQPLLMQINPDGKDLDLIQLKQLTRSTMTLYEFATLESEMESTALSRQVELAKKYHVLFRKVIAVSIDGFKRDRYMIKINDITKKVD